MMNSLTTEAWGHSVRVNCSFSVVPEHVLHDITDDSVLFSRVGVMSCLCRVLNTVV